MLQARRELGHGNYPGWSSFYQQNVQVTHPSALSMPAITCCFCTDLFPSCYTVVSCHRFTCICSNHEPRIASMISFPQRLQDLQEMDCSKYACLTAIVTEEMEQGTAKKTKSCTRAIIWLCRSINCSKYLLERLLETLESSLKEIVEEAYANYLKPWHGWISSAAYKVYHLDTYSAFLS